jgi:hypothetical protein
VTYGPDIVRLEKIHAQNETYGPVDETVDAHSGSHLLAACGTATASIGAFPHLANPLTIRGALFADFGAFATGEFVKFRAEQHEMRRRPTSAQAIIKVKCLGSVC